jgi:hypothetical protein
VQCYGFGTFYYGFGFSVNPKSVLRNVQTIFFKNPRKNLIIIRNNFQLFYGKLFSSMQNFPGYGSGQKFQIRIHDTGLIWAGPYPACPPGLVVVTAMPRLHNWLCCSRGPTNLSILPVTSIWKHCYKCMRTADPVRRLLKKQWLKFIYDKIYFT